MKPLRSRCEGLSLLELMITIAIVAVLAGMSFGIVQRSKRSAETAICASQLRHLGLAVHLYAQDNNQVLPGPLAGNQGATYSRNGNMIGRHLRPYFNLPEPVGNQILIAKELECPAARRSILSQGGSLQQAFYYNCPTTTVNGQNLRPLGYLGSGSTTIAPLSLANLGSQGILSKVVVLTEADHIHNPSLAGNPNVANISVHGISRNALYTDGHVAPFPENP